MLIHRFELSVSKCGDLKIRDFWDWYFGRGFGVCYDCVLCIVLMLVYACESLFMWWFCYGCVCLFNVMLVNSQKKNGSLCAVLWTCTKRYENGLGMSLSRTSNKFFFFFFDTKKGESNLTDYTTVGLNQLQFRGIWHAKLAIDQTELTISLGTKYTSQQSPFWFKKYKSASLICCSKFVVFLCWNKWTKCLLVPRNKIYWKPWFLALRAASTIASNSAPHVVFDDLMYLMVVLDFQVLFIC